MTSESPLPSLPVRRSDSHKGDYGRALIIGGSRGMGGAVALSGQAALRSGAGLVTLAVPDSIVSQVGAIEPSYMTLPLPQDEAGRIDRSAREALAERLDTATVVACGPGLSRSAGLDQFVAGLYQTVSQPLVVDADGLNALAESPTALQNPGGPRILTPHPGEFMRLAGALRLSGESDMEKLAELMAQRCRAVIVLKTHETSVFDGKSHSKNRLGNPGMATGGSGDVLTGVITALLCQGLPPMDAAHLGVHLHASAGDFAAERLGQVSLIASDLVRFLPDAFLELESNA